MYVDAIWTLSPVSFRVLVQFAFSFPLLLEFMKNVHRNNNKSRGSRAFVTFKNSSASNTTETFVAFVLIPIIPSRIYFEHL